MKTRTCPICCEGSLIQQHYTSVLTHKGVECKLHNFQHSVCTVCESQVADADQTKHNKLLAIAFQRMVDGFMPPSEVKRLRKKLRLTIKDASTVVGGGGVAFSKYENGTIRQSTAVDNLLKLLDKYPSLIDDLREFNQQRELCNNYQAALFVEPRSQTLSLPESLLGLFRGPAVEKTATFSPAVHKDTASPVTSFFSNWLATV